MLAFKIPALYSLSHLISIIKSWVGDAVSAFLLSFGIVQDLGCRCHRFAVIARGNTGPYCRCTKVRGGQSTWTITIPATPVSCTSKMCESRQYKSMNQFLCMSERFDQRPDHKKLLKRSQWYTGI